MFSTKFSRRVVALTLAVGAAAVVTTTASAKYGDSRPQGYLGVTEQNADGGVTPTNLARAVPRESSAPGGVTPTDLGRAVEPQGGKNAPHLWNAKEVDSSWSFLDRELVLGFGFGVALAIALSLAFAMGRNRIRIAHA